MKKFTLTLSALLLFFSAFATFYMLDVFLEPPAEVFSAQATVDDGDSGSLGSNSSGSDASIADSFRDVLCLESDMKNEILNVLEAKEGATTELTCMNVIQTCFSKHQEQFADLTAHFESNAANSDLFSPALDLILQWEKESKVVLTAMHLVWPQQKTIEAATSPLTECNKTQKSLYEILKKTLREYVTDSANAKRNYNLVYKYKEINKHLAELNVLMGKWSGNMDVVAQKIPALSKYCQ